MQRPPFVQTTIICIWTALTVRTETLAIIKWSKEARSWTEICTAFPFSAISEGNFCRACFRSSKSGWHHQSDRNDLKGQVTLCGQCRHDVRARIPRAFKCWWPLISSPWFSVSSSTSLQTSFVFLHSHLKELFQMGESGLILKSALSLSKPLLVH